MSMASTLLHFLGLRTEEKDDKEHPTQEVVDAARKHWRDAVHDSRNELTKGFAAAHINKVRAERVGAVVRKVLDAQDPDGSKTRQLEADLFARLDGRR